MQEQQQPGPFDNILQTATPERHDRSAIIVIGVIVALGVLLLALILPPISILDSGNGAEGPADSDTIATTRRAAMPELPEGFEAVSPLYDVAAPADLAGGVTLTVKLTARLPAGAAVSLYRHDGKNWKRVGEARVGEDGMSATSDLPALPSSLAVLRRSGTARIAFGALPAANEIDPRIGGALDTIQPLDYIPSPDGKVLGTTTALPDGLSYRVIPVISGIDPNAVEAILRSPEIQAAHINAIMDLVEANGFAGIDLSYRALDLSLEDAFLGFATTLAGQLHADGRVLVLSLPVPTTDGVSYETFGYDWSGLSEIADYLKIVPPDDRSSYRAQMTAALDHVTGEADRQKVLLGVSNVAYQKGADGIDVMPVSDALALAATIERQGTSRITPDSDVTLVGANLLRAGGATGLHWDDDALSVTFSYPGENGKRTVWVFNAFSAAFRLDLARQYGLAGVWIDNAGVPSGGSDIWSVVQAYLETGEAQLVKPNAAMLAPEWRASGGTLDAAGGESVQWRAPSEPGPYEVTLVVGDGVVRVGRAFPVEVERPRGAGGSP